MFDKLVESTKEKQGRRARRLFLATMAVYAVALTALGVATIIGFRPALAEGYDVLSRLTPPPVPSGPDPNPVQIKPNLNSAPDPGFVTPVKIKPLPLEEDLSKLLLDRKPMYPSVFGAPTGLGSGHGDGIPGGANVGEAPPPPPPTP